MAAWEDLDCGAYSTSIRGKAVNGIPEDTPSDLGADSDLPYTRYRR